MEVAKEQNAPHARLRLHQRRSLYHAYLKIKKKKKKKTAMENEYFTRPMYLAIRIPILALHVGVN